MRGLVLLLCLPALACADGEFHHAHDAPGGYCWHSHGPEADLDPDHALVKSCEHGAPEPVPDHVWFVPPPASPKVWQRDEAHLQGPSIRTRVDRARSDKGDRYWISLKDLRKREFEGEAHRCNDGEGNWVYVESEKQFDLAHDALVHGNEVVAYIRSPIKPGEWCILDHITIRD